MKEKQLDFYIKGKKDIELYSDKYYISKALDNLITNSILYSESGSVIITLTEDESAVEFKIEDEGIGIPVEDLYNIFKPFAVSSKTKVDYEGRGIGLALCEKILSIHNGKIWAEEKNSGACFRFLVEKK